MTTFVDIDPTLDGSTDIGSAPLKSRFVAELGKIRTSGLAVEASIADHDGRLISLETGGGGGGGIATLPPFEPRLVAVTASRALTAADAWVTVISNVYRTNSLRVIDPATPATDITLTVPGDAAALTLWQGTVPEENEGSVLVSLGASVLQMTVTATDASAVLDVTGNTDALAVLEVGDAVTALSDDISIGGGVTISSMDTGAAPPTITLSAAVTVLEGDGAGAVVGVTKSVGTINGQSLPIRVMSGTQFTVMIEDNVGLGPVVVVAGAIEAPVTLAGDIIAEPAVSGEQRALVGWSITNRRVELTGATALTAAHEGAILRADGVCTINKIANRRVGTVIGLEWVIGDTQPSFAAGTNVAAFQIKSGKAPSPAAEGDEIAVEFLGLSGSDEVWKVIGPLDDV